ncbi:MAG TPA: DUF4340 domain-containing protein [Dokdonella sp.]|uniref:DUF4340 domain-containing protein n=1 Tax=Dokdonella sp. TaxID=2291710 RepID=UPI0025C38F5D|nr:DUF4340 domain-containing protein [Dokdonella sp.]MBX3691541.1 DUF4340 domain-containing protein [Dokdonella sp.]MCW5568398.1 DUF4340 domain-containing protein [Dokdonella sp.]HNR92020.1 DUF4340 domain-containing protein [Dokdonella sp.]
MRRTARINLTLAVIAALLGALVWWQVHNEMSALEPPLSALDTSTVTSLRVGCAGCVERRFGRGPDGWRMHSPYALDADPAAIARLLAIAAAPVRLREPAEGHDLARLGLDPPQMTLELDAKRIEIGTTDALRGDRYVRDGTHIARVPDRFSPFLLAAPESELDRRLVPRGATITALRIDDADASARLAAWHAMPVSRITPAGGEDESATAHMIRATLADGETITWRLVRSGDAWIARRASPALDYHLDASAVAALFDTGATP